MAWDEHFVSVGCESPSSKTVTSATIKAKCPLVKIIGLCDCICIFHTCQPIRKDSEDFEGVFTLSCSTPLCWWRPWNPQRLFRIKTGNLSCRHAFALLENATAWRCHAYLQVFWLQVFPPWSSWPVMWIVEKCHAVAIRFFCIIIISILFFKFWVHNWLCKRFKEVAVEMQKLLDFQSRTRNDIKFEWTLYKMLGHWDYINYSATSFSVSMTK